MDRPLRTRLNPASPVMTDCRSVPAARGMTTSGKGGHAIRARTQCTGSRAKNNPESQGGALGVGVEPRSGEGPWLRKVRTRGGETNLGDAVACVRNIRWGGYHEVQKHGLKTFTIGSSANASGHAPLRTTARTQALAAGLGRPLFQACPCRRRACSAWYSAFSSALRPCCLSWRVSASKRSPCACRVSRSMAPRKSARRS